MNSLLFEDIGYFDLTTFGLGIEEEEGKISFSPKQNIILCGANEVVEILKELDLKYRLFKKNGDIVKEKEIILECEGTAKQLHKAWKICQNIFEYMSGIATFTHHLVLLAKEINPNITVSTTRKNFPGSKELMLKAVISGGGVPHRLGLYDSILIFKEHIEFFADRRELEKKFTLLKHKFLEKRITVEVETFEEAKYFALLGVDILQCEKMDFQTLQKCVELKKDFPNILLSATGGIHEKNIQEYVKTGVDFIVTSSPYHAKPTDIKVEMKADKPWLFVNSL